MEQIEDKLIGTLTVSNINQKDLFRIHLFKKSLKLDKKFALGLIGNVDVYNKIMEISSKWTSKRLDSAGIFMEVISLLKEHESDLSHLFFSKSELDEVGRYIEPSIIDSSKIKSISDKLWADEHYCYLKKTGNLNKIDENLFRAYLENQTMVDCYLDNFEDYLKYTYYTYFIEDKDEIKQCLLMTYNDTVITAISRKV